MSDTTANGAPPRLQKRSDVIARSKVVPTVPDGLADLAVTGEALLAPAAAPIDWVVDGLLENQGVAIVAGLPKKARKTWMLLDLGIARSSRRVARLQGASRSGQGPLRLHRDATRGLRAALRRPLQGARRRPAPRRRVPRRDLRAGDDDPREERERTREVADVRTKVAAVKMLDRERRAELLNGAGRIADAEANALGANLDALTVIEDATEGTWSLIVIDKLRDCLAGDENSSRDASRYTRCVRELGAAAGCPVVSAHHLVKNADGADPAGARGSGELVAAPDAIVMVDARGNHPTLHFTLRGHVDPPPIGVELVVIGEDGLGLAVRGSLALPVGARARRGEHRAPRPPPRRAHRRQDSSARPGGARRAPGQQGEPRVD